MSTESMSEILPFKRPGVCVCLDTRLRNTGCDNSDRVRVTSCQTVNNNSSSGRIQGSPSMGVILGLMLGNTDEASTKLVG